MCHVRVIHLLDRVKRSRTLKRSGRRQRGAGQADGNPSVPTRGAPP